MDGDGCLIMYYMYLFFAAYTLKPVCGYSSLASANEQLIQPENDVYLSHPILFHFYVFCSFIFELPYKHLLSSSYLS